jgi:hypothetical protein
VLPARCENGIAEVSRLTIATLVAAEAARSLRATIADLRKKHPAADNWLKALDDSVRWRLNGYEAREKKKRNPPPERRLWSEMPAHVRRMAAAERYGKRLPQRRTT